MFGSVQLTPWLQIAGGIIGFLVLLLIIFKLVGVRVIRSDQVGIVEKWWSTKGSLEGRIIALNGEAGYQPDILRGGIHFRSPVMFRVHRFPLVTIPQGQIGYIFARDGEPLPPQQTLGKVIEGNNFQDIAFYINNGGQKGPQRAILREGTYAFNLAQFVILTANQTYYMPMRNEEEDQNIAGMAEHLSNLDGFAPVVIKGDSDQMGIVTVHDGPSLSHQDIIAPTVGDDPQDAVSYHNNFQDPEKFLVAGGSRGRQYQVLTDGTYFINRLFATVDLLPKTVIEVGNVGVVVSYIGPKGADQSGEDYKHGELVENGNRGVWQDPLMPGKYAFNIYAGNISKVPTTNIILKWIAGESGAHQYDENLAEVNMITKDAFELLLPLSVVIHINYKNAPLVIQRFAEIKKLVNDTLDPMVSAYFKNEGQKKTYIELIQNRMEIQTQATSDMRERFQHYNLELEEVLIGTPQATEANNTNVELILTQLRNRQIAKEQMTTYEQQQAAAAKERSLNEAKAAAEAQRALTQSQINIQVNENQGKAELAKAKQDAESIKALARAEGEKASTIGDGEAHAIKVKSDAFGGPQRQLTLEVAKVFTQAIQEGRIPLVPETLVNMGADGNGSGSMSNSLGLLAMLMNMDKLGIDLGSRTEPATVPAGSDSMPASEQSNEPGNDGGAV